MSKLFIEVLNMSLMASYVIIFVMLIRIPLKKAPKAVSYALWSVVGFRLIIPFSFESSLSLIPKSLNMTPIPKDIVYQQNPQIISGIRGVDTFINQSLPRAAIGASVNPLQIYTEIMAYVWIIGIILLLTYGIVSVVILNNKLKGARLLEDNIYIAENLKTPFVLGFMKPKIYLPSSLKNDEKNYILLHEQTHIKRKDHIVKMLAFLILSIHWFNPLVWLAFILMGADMELSCDERVLKEMNKDIKKPYANSLLSLAAGRHMLNASPLAFGEGNVKGRIKNVMNYKKPKFWIVIISVVVLFLAGISLASNPNQNTSFLFPPEENQEVVLEPGQIIFINEGSTDYSLGAVGSEFILTDDKLVVTDGGDKQIFEISYDKNTISFDELEKQVPIKENFSDRGSYKNITSYDLCNSTKDSPGYRLYMLNDSTYWMATLYNNNIWRIMEMNSTSWTKK